MNQFIYPNRFILIVIVPLLISFGQSTAYEGHSDAVKITVENVEQIQVLDSIDLPPINQLAWASDENRLAIATQDGVWLYNVADGTTKQLGEQEFASDVSFLGTTSRIAVNYNNRSLIFDTETLKLIRQLPSYFDRISHDGRVYAIVNTDSIQLFSTLDDTLLNRIPIKHLQPCEYACRIQDLAFSWDDKSIVFSAGVPEVENGIINIETGKRLSPIQLGIWGLEFDPEGTIIASSVGELGYLSRTVEFTDSTTGQLISTFKIFGGGVIFNSDGGLAVIRGLDDHAPNPDVASGTLHFFDMNSIKSTKNLDASLAIRIDTFSTWITTAQFSPTSKYLALGDKSGNFYLLGLPS